MSGKDVPTDPDELRADVEQTRRELGDTVEALVHKADVPGRVKDKAHEGADKVKETATRANAAAAAAAAKTAAAVGNAAHKAGEKVGEVKAGAVREKAAETATVVAAQVNEKAAVVGQKAGVVASQVGEKAAVVASQVGEKAAHAVEALPPPVQQRVDQGVRQARRHPAAVAAGVAALVLVLWKLMRRGR